MVVWYFILNQVSKVKMYLIGAAFLVAWFFNEKRKAKNQGKQEITQKIKERQDALEAKWKSIDGRPVSFDNALDRLRNK